ncbi:hypothetical protein BTO20_06900 [Mycobacterium dioxanotrophicus]|jgi:hypothetical protein|uniref:DUF222 domain-containing protein n=1 Tax=Mycobacterium dioxanotrophicus TaxID=482462 RepID=A0A1Y0CDY2_9MYCO|nr:hypothetical protein [Mycobacterium dioxanotrophicus]ART73468.1 hypothetical protein BTO20_06900 [Mycobacterium dioxanotrophicus]
MSNSYEQIRGHLAHAEGVESAAQPRHLRLVLAEVGELLGKQPARAVVDDEVSIAAAGKSSGLTENAVGASLANTSRLAPYATTGGRVGAENVRRARNDKWANAQRAAAACLEPRRFKPRRNAKRS